MLPRSISTSVVWLYFNTLPSFPVHFRFPEIILHVKPVWLTHYSWKALQIGPKWILVWYSISEICCIFTVNIEDASFIDIELNENIYKEI